MIAFAPSCQSPPRTSPRSRRQSPARCRTAGSVSGSQSAPRSPCWSSSAGSSSPPLSTDARRVEQVKRPHSLGEQRIVTMRPLPRALEHGLEAGRVRHGDAADVQKMDRGGDLGERRVLVQGEGGGEHLESDSVLHVGEWRPVVVEADRLLRTLARPRDPGELRLAVDEALDEPRTGQAIDPGRLARRPYALLVARALEWPQALHRRARLVARIQLAVAFLER